MATSVAEEDLTEENIEQHLSKIVKGQEFFWTNFYMIRYPKDFYFLQIFAAEA